MKTRVLTVLLLGAGLVAGCGDDDSVSPLAGWDTGVPMDGDMMGGNVDAPLADGSADGSGDGGGDVALDAAGDAAMPDDANAPDGGMADATPDAAPTMVMGTVTTTGGGQVQVGGATVSVLGGSIATDTTVTLTTTEPVNTTPNRMDVSGSIYTFAPAGTSFSSPISVTLPVSADLPNGKSPTIAWYDDVAKAWVALPSAWRRGDAVITALTSRAGTFAVLLGEGGAGGPQAATTYCPKIEACGGTLSGTYNVTSSCSSAGTTTELKTCGSGTAWLVSADEGAGSLTFTGEMFERAFSVVPRRNVVADEACTASYKTSGTLTCTAVAAGVLGVDTYSWTCSGSIDSRCVCSGVPTTPGPTLTSTGTFSTTAAGKLTLVSGPVMTAQDYCVQGNALSLRDNRGSVTTALKAP